MEAWSYGHSINCRGANYFVDEVDICKEVLTEVLALAIENGQSSAYDVSNDLKIDKDVRGMKITKANAKNCEWYISIHCNSANFNGEDFTYNEVGTECWIYPNNKESERVASAFCENLSKLGFKNRGIKTTTTLSEIVRPSGNAIIVELFFVNSLADVQKFKEVGAKEIARILYGTMYGFPDGKKKCPTCGQTIK